MRMPRPRYRLRTSLILIALLALLMGGAKLKVRRDDHLRVAASHAAQVQRCRNEARMYAERARGRCDGGEYWYSQSEYQDRLAAYHADLEAKYLRAASRPWGSVPPDPPRESPPEDPMLKALMPRFVNLLDVGELIDEEQGELILTGNEVQVSID